MNPPSPPARQERPSAMAWCVLLTLSFLMGTVAFFCQDPAWQGAVQRLPGATAGDETYYVLLVNSLLQDGDFQLQDDYRRAEAGGLDAGRRSAGKRIWHHTWLVNPRTDGKMLWSSLWGLARPSFCATHDCTQLETEFQEPGVREYSSHPAAYAILTAAILWPFQPAPTDVERLTRWWVLLTCMLGVWLTFLVARNAGLDEGNALAACVLLSVASPWLTYSHLVFCEPLMGVMLLLGTWCMQRGKPRWMAWCGVGAMAIKPYGALVGAGWVIQSWRRGERREAVQVAVVTLVGGSLLIAFNVLQTGIPFITGDLGWSWPTSWKQLGLTLWDSQYGLIVFVPWVLASVAGMVRAKRDALVEHMAWPLVLLVVLFSVHRYQGWSCYGPRYWVTFMPWLSILAVRAASRSGVTFKVCLVATAMLALVIAMAGAVLPAERVFDAPWTVSVPKAWNAFL